MKKLFYILNIGFVLFLLQSCNEEEFPIPEASTIDAGFSTQSNTDDPQTISFINETNIAANAGTVSYIWDFADGNTSTEENPTHTYTQTGIYNVSLIVTADDDVDTFESTVTAIGSLDVSLFFAGGTEGRIGELPGNGNIKSGLGTVYGVDYDPNSEKVYYSDASAGTLMRMNFDGTEDEELLSGLISARDVALNLDDNKAYVVDRGDNAVYEVDLTSGSSKVLFDNGSGSLGELPIAIDYYDGFLYITCVEIGSESVWKGDVNGNSINVIIDYNDGGYGYGLAIDKVNEKIYFDDTDTGSILRADLDGGNIESLIATSGSVYGIVVDNVNNLIYWSDSGDGLIKKANLDGSEIVPVSVPLSDPLGLFFIP